MAGTPVATQSLIDPGHVVVIRSDRKIVSISPTGDESGVLGLVPPSAGEPDAVAASADGRLVLVSAVKYDDDDATTCAAVVLQVLPDNRLRQLADGAAVALAADGSRLAYFRYANAGGFCRRTVLVVRDLQDGAETTMPAPADGLVGGTPSEWPVNWSPDAKKIAHVTRSGAVVTEVVTARTEAIDEDPEVRLLTPAWLTDGRLVALHGCCIGGASVRADGSADEVFATPGPLRSLRPARDGVGAWFTVEEQGLHHWDGKAVRAIYRDALLTSG